MKIMKILMCITMLFVFACDSDDGANAPTMDDLQGTWDITNTCFSGTVPEYSDSDDNVEETFIGCLTIPSGSCTNTMDDYGYSEWTIIEGNQATSCNNEFGYTDCDGDSDTIMLSGNTLTVITSDGESENLNISLSSNGGMATVVVTIAEESCSATITQTWTKQ